MRWHSGGTVSSKNRALVLRSSPGDTKHRCHRLQWRPPGYRPCPNSGESALRRKRASNCPAACSLLTISTPRVRRRQGRPSDPPKIAHLRLHHLLFEYNSLDDLMSTFQAFRRGSTHCDLQLPQTHCRINTSDFHALWRLSVQWTLRVSEEISTSSFVSSNRKW